MEPEMQEMMQGQGIIDIVNSYLGIALSRGMIGLLLFLMIFLSLLYRIYIHYSRAPDEEVRVLGKILFSILISFMVMIFTVSMISYISYYMWILIALSASYINLARNELQLEKQ
jgi:O-antigen ligase